MSIQTKFPRFFVTTPSPCPYLPGQTERKLFTELRGAGAAELHDALSQIGFRRSQSVAYRPSCVSCSACVSVRTLTQEFAPNATQRRLIRRYGDLDISACRPWATNEQFALLQRYLEVRHARGGMVGMDETDFADMIEVSPVDSYIVEYRDNGRLIGACLTDRQADGLSLIYSFFDPDYDGMGTFIILDHITRAAAANLPHVYLGYWVQGAKAMEYKARFRPMERLGPGGWQRVTEAEAAPSLRGEGAEGSPGAHKF